MSLLAIFYIYLLLSAAFDLIYMKIPNWLTIGVFPFILAYKFYLGSWALLTESLVTYFAVVLVLFVPFVLRGLGAGDLKFFANIAAFVGFKSTLPCFMLGAICSLPIALYYAFRYRDRIIFFLKKRKVAPEGQVKFAYSPPFAIGTIIYLSQPELVSFLFR